MTSKLSQDNVTAENHDLKFNFSEFSWSKSHLKAYDIFPEMLYFETFHFSIFVSKFLNVLKNILSIKIAY